jgi:hypothetical protein
MSHALHSFRASPALLSRHHGGIYTIFWGEWASLFFLYRKNHHGQLAGVAHDAVYG